MVTVLTNDNFESEVLKADKPVLVDFFATWCGPCKMLSPVIDEIGDEHDDFKVCKLNVNECADLAAQYNVMSIPTLIVFENGQVKHTSLGVKSKEEIVAMVK